MGNALHLFKSFLACGNWLVSVKNSLPQVENREHNLYEEEIYEKGEKAKCDGLPI